MKNDPGQASVHEQAPASKTARRLFVAGSGVICLAVLGLHEWTLRQQALDERSFETRFVDGITESQRASFEEEAKIRAQIMNGGEFHGRLRAAVDIEGFANPEFISIERATLADSTPVIGLEVAGKAYCFDQTSLLDPRSHIITFIAGKRSVAVTYCDQNDCARVFTSPGDSDQLIPLRVGGLDYDDSMVLLLDGIRYSHQSDRIPLDQVPFERTTFGEWAAKHPETLHFVGDGRFED